MENVPHYLNPVPINSSIFLSSGGYTGSLIQIQILYQSYVHNLVILVIIGSFRHFQNTSYISQSFNM